MEVVEHNNKYVGLDMNKMQGWNELRYSLLFLGAYFEIFPERLCTYLRILW